MLLNQLTSFSLTLLLVDQSDIVNMLVIVVILFGVLLILGIRKSYKLKKENERLDALNKKIAEEEDKPYQDFTHGHMYCVN